MTRFSSPMPPLDVGGQAVLEGVMMRSPRSLCVAVRTPRGDIVVKEHAWRSLWDQAPGLRFLRRPGLRGLVVFAEALVNGLQALHFSARWAYEDAESEEKLSDWALVTTLALSFAFGLGLFVALPHLLAFGLGAWTGGDAEGKTLGFHLLDGAIKLGLFVGYLWAIGRLRDIRRVFQQHGAEHKVLYAYEMGDPLTVEAASRYPTLHPRCGTSFLLTVVLVSVLLFSVVFPLLPTLSESRLLNHLGLLALKLPLLLPVAALAYEVNRWASRRMDSPFVRALVWPGLSLQRLTTVEPEPAQLEVALTALRCVLWREQAGAAAVREQGGADVETFPSYEDVAARVPV